MSNLDPEERNRRADELERQISRHPGLLEHHTIQALADSLTVHRLNYADLETLLVQPTNNLALGIELVQNVKDSQVRRAFDAQLLRAFHNYLASTQSLVEHVRAAMRGRVGSTADEFARRREAVSADPSIRFFQDLRNFTMHRSLPPLQYELDISEPGQPSQTETFTIGMPVAALKAWEGWKARSKPILDGGGAVVDLPALLSRHASLVDDLNNWLIQRLHDENAVGRAAVNELITEREMVVTGLNRETVLARIRDRSTRTDYPSGAAAE